MASFDTLLSVAAADAYQQRVKYAMTVAAVNVYAEASSTTGHQARSVLAAKVIQGGFGSYGAAALATLTNATLASEATNSPPDFGISDGDLQFTVNSLWNALANA